MSLHYVKEKEKPSVLDTKSITRKFDQLAKLKSTKYQQLKQHIMNTIIGRVTKNAEINQLKNDRQVVNFSVAINYSYRTKDGERKEQTTYYNCSYWISPNVVKILTKGTLVELSGRISSSAWIGKDGEIKSGLNFHTSKIKLHGGGKKSETGNANFNQRKQPDNQLSQNTQNTNPFADETDDDLPF